MMTLSGPGYFTKADSLPRRKIFKTVRLLPARMAGRRWLLLLVVFFPLGGVPPVVDHLVETLVGGDQFNIIVEPELQMRFIRAHGKGQRVFDDNAVKNFQIT